MLRIGKLTDYGTLILTRMTSGECVSASELAEQTRLGPPTASKILKALAHAGIVSSVRGARGGYSLARPATDISAAQIIDALEGPVAITECATGAGSCELESVCRVGNAWQHINTAIRQSLEAISLAELADWQSGAVPFLDLGARSPAISGEASTPPQQPHKYTSNA